ncbi:helicase-like protein [Trypanosoma conorhini]|uniref:Helicase-like protein n=1 Tax=Trypanosoma conorhini TaxID=83891 RepID=A0A422PJR5_9TRYP|nr:helicase-like protein [Trypanosoma conorhini]RNF17956.1 helicase-like protein [Trypanosoma conorhini]
MGQLTSAARATDTLAASGRNEDSVLFVRPEGARECPPPPPHELRAEELYESYVQPLEIVPPLLRTSAGLSPASSAAEPTLLHSLHQRWNSFVVSQGRLMEREALQQQEQQRACDTSDGSYSVTETGGKGALTHELREFANSWRALETNAATQANADAHAVDRALLELNRALVSVKGVAIEQQHVVELFTFAEAETRALREEVVLATGLLQDDVIALLRDTWSLLSDAERTELRPGLDTHLKPAA